MCRLRRGVGVANGDAEYPSCASARAPSPLERPDSYHRAMSSPLDEAAKKLAQDEAFDATWRKRQDDVAAVQRARFIALVDDFLAGVQGARNIGTNHEWKVSRFRKVPAWHFTYYDGEKPGHITLTVDGRIPQNASNGRGGFELVSYRDFEKALTDENLESLARNMVKLMRSVGTR